MGILPFLPFFWSLKQNYAKRTYFSRLTRNQSLRVDHSPNTQSDLFMTGLTLSLGLARHIEEQILERFVPLTGVCDGSGERRQGEMQATKIDDDTFLISAGSFRDDPHPPPSSVASRHQSAACRNRIAENICLFLRVFGECIEILYYLLRCDAVCTEV